MNLRYRFIYLGRFIKEGISYFIKLPLHMKVFGFGVSAAVFLFFAWQKVRRKDKLNRKEAVFLWLTILYLTFVFLITTVARTPEKTAKYNFSLLHTLREVRAGSLFSAKMIFFNLAMLFPMGVLLPAALEYRCSLGDILFLAFLISFSIECTQYLFRLGFMETDDLIYNCIGALLGYFLARLMKLIFGRKQRAGG